MAENLLASLGRYVPEVIVSITMVAALYLEACYGHKEKGRTYVFTAVALGLISAAMALISNFSIPSVPIFTNAAVIDPFSTAIKLIMVISVLGVLYLCKESEDIVYNLKSEFLVLMLGVLIGGMLLASANNLLSLYIGLETLSVLSYVMASFKKNNARSAEAGVKYVLYGGLASGLMLFGMSHIYGVLGSIQFNELIGLMKDLPQEKVVVLLPSSLFFFVGLGYKIACFPFHMWSPDVYEGSPLPVTTFFSLVPKFAGMAALVRVSFVLFNQDDSISFVWTSTLQIVAALTMTVGNISAIGQKSVKRMLAYSSISHAGMMLLGVLVINELGNRAIVFYALTYVFMTLVAFYIVNFINNEFDNDHFERFSGLVKRYPFMAIMMAASMFSLAGLPPFSGFVAKFNIISAVVANGYYTIAVIAALNSVISLYYYMKVVRLMMLSDFESEQKITGFGFLNQLIICALTVPVLALGVFWEDIINFAHNAKIVIQ